MMADSQEEALLAALDELYQESTAKLPQFSARQIAERANIDPAGAVKSLFNLKETTGLNFYRAGGGDPDHSFVICPFKDDAG